MTPTLTPVQYVVLADAIRSPANNAALGEFITNNDDQAIADWYNDIAIPDYWVFRNPVSRNELTQETSQDGTTFSWVGTGFIGRSAGERDAWRELFDAQGMCNPSLANVVQAFQDIFSGATPPAPANRTHLAAIVRRKATRVELVFAVGVGTVASPSRMATQGPLTYLEVAHALRNVGA